uniref:Uncharacterized protein n=1 Tax=Kalanchoe fedtschenkoi TaxID=63787 RepID=A0A7N0TBA9_KALFE
MNSWTCCFSDSSTSRQAKVRNWSQYSLTVPVRLSIAISPSGESVIVGPKRLRTSWEK